MKILIVVPYLSNGGAERAMFNLALFFHQKGIEVTIAAASDNAPNKELLPAEIQFYTLGNNAPLGNPAFISNTKKLLRIINTLKPDIVLSTSDYLNIAVLLAKKISKINFKVVISQQVHIGNYIKELPLKNRIFIRLIQKYIGRNANIVVGASEGVSANYSLLNNLKYPSGRIATIYNPIFENSILQNALIDPSDNNFKRTSINIITVGRLIKQKDQVTLIKAFSKIIATYPDATLFIIGEGPEEKNLKELITKLHLGQQVVFLGYQNNPYSFVSRCDLFVLSSIYEGFGNVIVEALAVSTNVVSTDCPSGPAEILNYGEYGNLCEPGNENMLAKAMVDSLKKPFSKTKLLQRAQQYSVEKSGTQFVELFQHLNNA